MNNSGEERGTRDAQDGVRLPAMSRKRILAMDTYPPQTEVPMSRLQESAAFAPTITPSGQAIEAGPWRLTLTDAQLADEAYATIVATNSGNNEAPAGLVWVLARFSAENISDQRRIINLTDFAATGTDGILRRPPASVCPEPSLQTTVEAGASAEGWVPLQVNDAGNVIIWFSSPFLGGTDEAWFALTDGATLPSSDPAPDDSGLGTSPDNPATFNQAVRAGDFDVAIVDHITGQAVFDIGTTGLRALGADTAESWHALRVRATNISNRPAFFSFTALRVADVDGEAWDHVLALTPPTPDVAKEILPGATRDGWMAFDEQPWSTLALIRVQPSYIADEPRFITFGGAPTASSTPNEPTPAPDFAPGDTVILTEDRVNLREDASVGGEIIVELKRDTRLTITGDAVDADGYTWYPVEVDDTGEAGYVVADFLASAGNDS